MNVLVFGAGGHARVVIQILNLLGYTIAGALEDHPGPTGKPVLNTTVVGPFAYAEGVDGACGVLAFGNNRARKELAERYSHIEWLTLAHPRAFVDASASIGPGSIIAAGAIVNPGATVGAHCIVNTGATVGHDVVVGDYAHVAPGANIAGWVNVGEGAWVGVGAAVRDEVSIGAWSIIGAGAAVVTDIPPNVTAYGVPAKVVKQPD